MGITQIRTKLRCSPAKYKDIQWNQEEEALDIGGVLYNNPYVHVKKIGMLTQDLAEIRAEFDE